MYCNTCKSFVEGKTYSVLSDSIDPPETVCEVCGSDDIEPADNCPYCGDPIRSDQDVCDGCRKTAETILGEAICKIGTAFDVSHRAAKQILESILDE